jgi:hypothetical protein
MTLGTTRLRAVLLLAVSSLLALLLVRPLDAQVLYGSVSGTITDQSGAVVPNAPVTLTNEGTGLKRQTTTDSSGSYRVLDLPQGNYTIEVTATGFKPLKITNVSVAIGQVNAKDLQLQVGTTTQEVTVLESAITLQTQKADVHTEISSYAVENLPLSTYRNFQSAELLTPGVFSNSGISNSYPNSIADTPERSFEINSTGLPGHDNTTRVDGATNIFIWLPDHMLIVPPQESIAEVNVQTANYDVEKGLTAGAAMDVVTKSGTNQLHGSIYAFHTDDALNAKNWYTKGDNTGILNNDGAAIGGPIKRNKLFFFANWDGTWQHAAEGFTDIVPTDDMKAGDFSKYLGAAVPGRTVCTSTDTGIGPNVPLQQGMVFDPATGNADGTGRCVFSSGGTLNKIPSGRLNAGALAFNALIPEPNANLGVIGSNTPFNIIGAKGARPLSRNIGTARVDWNQSQNHVIWVKWTIQQDNFFEPFDLGDAGGDGSGSAYQRAQIGTLGHTWTLSPTLVLTGHIGFDRMTEYALPPGFGKPLGESLLGIAGTNTPAGDIRYTGLPGVSIQGFSGMGSLNSWEPDNRNDWTLTTAHNLTWIRGAHEFRTGVDISHNHLNAFQPEIFCCPRGNVVEDYGATALNLTSGGAQVLTPFVQNSFAAWDLGLISEAQNDAQFIKSTGKDTQFALYFGDRWKVTPKLTADLGVRWEYFPLITRDGIDKLERFDTSTGLLLFGGLGGNPTHLGITSSKKLFMPRVGLAYQINSKTVARAGFGMSNDTTPLERPLRGFYPLAIGADVFDTSTASEAAACNGQTAGGSCFGTPAGNGTFAQGVPVIAPPNISSGSLNVGAVSPGLTIGTLGPGEFHRGYVESWNVFVQRQLPADFVVNLGYVGNHYVHEFNGRDLAAAPLGGVEPSYGGIQYTGGLYQFQGYLGSHYNSLQMSVNHRTGHGLFIQAAYTYSRAMGYVNDNTWENGLEFNCPPSPALPKGCLPLNYGPLSFDHTHNFKLAYVYDLPFGSGKKWASSNNVVNNIVGGWKFNGVFTAFTGSPLAIGQDSNTLATFDTNQVPNHVAPVQYLGGANNAAGFPQWFNANAFAPNTADCTVSPCSAASIGNIDRTQSWLRGPGLWQLDTSLARTFKITERFSFEIRGEAENLFNKPHFFNPDTSCTNVNGACGGTFGELTSSYGERVVQIGAFVRF